MPPGTIAATGRSEVFGGEGVEMATLSGPVDLRCHFEDALPGSIESGEDSGLRIGGPGIEAEDRVLVEEERYLDRSVMTPEADAVPLGVVAAALVGKTEAH